MARRKTKTVVDSEQGSTASKSGEDAPSANGANVGRPAADDGHYAWGNGLRPRIEKLAYELYVQGGYRNGRYVEDWLEAERQTLAQPDTTRPNGSH